MMEGLISTGRLYHLCRVVFCLALAFLIAGCLRSIRVPLQATEKELGDIREGEGVVIGSVLFKVIEESGEKEPSQGRKAGEATYELYMHQLTKKRDVGNYIITVTLGEESVFVINLPAGDYEIHDIFKNQGLLEAFLNIPPLRASTRIFLSVRANETAYAGRLVITLPHKIEHGSRYGIKVEDDQENAVASLRERYPHLVSKVEKELMVLGPRHYRLKSTIFRDDPGYTPEPIRVPQSIGIKFK